MKLKNVVQPMIVVCAALFSLSAAPHAHAATFTVTKLADTNDGACDADCSLREAITAANTAAGDDTISFAMGVAGVIQLQSVLPDLSSNINLQGSGANVLTVRGEGMANPFRIFVVTDGQTVNISDLAISNGRASDGIFPGGSGGAIFNDGILTLSRVNLHGNSSTGPGGGISNRGTLNIVSSTLTGNSTTDRGGALFNLDFATISNSTLSGNSASLGGGAIRLRTGSVTLLNNTIAFNSCDDANSSGGGIGLFEGLTSVTLSGCLISNNSAATSPDVYGINGAFVSNGFNFVGNGEGGDGLTNGVNGDQIGSTASPLDPKLGPLTNNGGPTQTCALLPGSPAINAGDPNFAPPPATDQRGTGFDRVYGGRIDIGSLEVQPAKISVNNPTSVLEGSADVPGSIIFTVTLDAPSTQSVTVKYRSRDGINNPATAGSDYRSVGGTLIFAPGVTKKRVRVNFIGDDKAEPKETFFLDLYSPTNAAIADGRGVGTIANDDATPNVFEDEPSQ